MNGPRIFSLADLEEATSNWAATRVLGTGGFAKVFLGVFRGGDKVAIKRVTIPEDQRERQFTLKGLQAERETMAHYVHQNICTLVGWYVEEENMNVPYCLVYELCENGSLLERLHCCDHTNREVPALTAKERLVIALGTCRALEFLHVKALPPIVHRDIKSANILLDANFSPKVCDFGTVRQDELADNSTHIKTETVIGTRCYMPVECTL
jgi:serine/threonine protein kinase